MNYFMYYWFPFFSFFFICLRPFSKWEINECAERGFVPCLYLNVFCPILDTTKKGAPPWSIKGGDASKKE